MPIDVLREQMYLEGDPRKPARSRVVDSIRDEDLFIERFLSSLSGTEFPYLRFINLETATIFHQESMPQLASELAKSCERSGDPLIASKIREVSKFVLAALGARDTHIAFRARATNEIAGLHQ